MKTKFKAVLICSLYAMVLKSQFGQNLYPHRNSTLSAGIVTSNYPGHLMAGYSWSSGPNTPDFYIDKVDNNGTFTGTGQFSGEYTIGSIINCVGGLGPRVFNCRGISVIEEKINNELYHIAGTCDEGLFYAQIDFTGMVVACTGFYSFPGLSVIPPSKPLIIKNPGSGFGRYMCGRYNNDLYVMSTNGCGGVGWSSFYNSNYMEPRGIIESPYNPNELIVVGVTIPDPTTNVENAFFLKLDAGTGAILSYNIYGDSNTPSLNNSFCSIAAAASTYGGSDGYIIGGSSDDMPSGDFGPSWMLKVDPNGNIIWNTLIPSSSGYHRTRDVTGVLERKNTTGNYEYYGVAGSIVSDFNNRVTVFKLDDTGALFTGGSGNNEFIYTGGGNRNLYAALTDINNSVGGIQVYTTDQIGGNHYMVKAYYSGESGCSEVLNKLTTTYKGPNLLPNPGISMYGSLSQCPFSNGIGWTSVTTSPNTLCMAATVPGGSNAKTAATSITENRNEASNYIRIMPNPSSDKLSLNFHPELAGKQVSISIFNMLGQQVGTLYSDKISEETGNVEFSFRESGLEKGVYLVNAEIDGAVYKYKVIYSGE